MATLERAMAIAAAAHRGQCDKAGEPYLLHPIRVMLRVSGHDERLVALLHDVVEDSPWTLEQLRAEGFPEAVILAVDRVTRREGEPYQAVIERAGADPLARRVKLADLEDNIDAGPAARAFSARPGRLERYRRAHARLSDDSQTDG